MNKHLKIIVLLAVVVVSLNVFHGLIENCHHECHECVEENHCECYCHQVGPALHCTGGESFLSSDSFQFIPTSYSIIKQKDIIKTIFHPPC